MASNISLQIATTSLTTTDLVYPTGRKTPPRLSRNEEKMLDFLSGEPLPLSSKSPKTPLNIIL